RRRVCFICRSSLDSSAQNESETSCSGVWTKYSLDRSISMEKSALFQQQRECSKVVHNACLRRLNYLKAMRKIGNTDDNDEDEEVANDVKANTIKFIESIKDNNNSNLTSLCHDDKVCFASKHIMDVSNAPSQSLGRLIHDDKW